jgi:hypothetical protein
MLKTTMIVGMEPKDARVCGKARIRHHKSFKPKNKIIINRKYIPLAAAQGIQKLHQIEKRTICTKIPIPSPSPAFDVRYRLNKF